MRLVRKTDAVDAHSIAMSERERLPLAIAHQPAWLAWSWPPGLDDPPGRAQAGDLAARLPTAPAVLADLPGWTCALTG